MMGKKLDAGCVADRILELSRRRGMDLRELAEKAGLSGHTLKNIVNEINTPNLRTAIKLANVHGVSLDWLCGGGGMG
jgi:transcriptional regulator with XRE-family HTH domain